MSAGSLKASFAEPRRAYFRIPFWQNAGSSASSTTSRILEEIVTKVESSDAQKEGKSSA